MNTIQSQAQRCQEWLSRHALPTWLHTSFDPISGLFHEGLYADARPYQENVRRFRVQPRQIYVFSHAHLQGLINSTSQIDLCIHQGLNRFTNQNGEFIFSLDNQLKPSGHSVNAYEHAFALLGYVWHYHLTLDPESKQKLEQIYQWFESALKAPYVPGFYSSLSDHDLRCQNPHMHLFEALMVCYELTDEAIWLKRARAIYRLFETVLLRKNQTNNGYLGEFFTATWSTHHPLSRQVDPGHHYEWIWLLHHYSKLTATDVSDHIATLEQFANQYGHNPNGLVRDEVLSDGTPLRSTSRLWCQTEYLKAQIALWENSHHHSYRDNIISAVERIFDHYLTPAKPGLWLDHLDEHGQALHHDAPASTFYHLFLAFSELNRIANKDISCQ